MTLAPEQPTVLLVEDHADFCDLVRRLLAREGYHLAVAGNGRAALAYLQGAREHLPELILLDLHLPDMDGGQFRTLQRADPLLARIPVVLVSAADDVAEEAAALGAVDWLAKPVSITELRAVVRKWCAPALSVDET